jgi:iron complex transport system permease protein
VIERLRHAPLLVLGLLLGLAALASLLVGPSGVGLPSEPGVRSLVLTEIRLPRALLGLLVGAALGGAGAALQSYLRNPLAEPGLIGVTSGAMLGAVLVIHSGLAATFALALPLGGLAGAALATFFALVLAGERAGPLTLILAGVAVSSLAAALTTLALNLSPNPFATTEMVFWMMGSLADRSLKHVFLAGPLILAGLALLISVARRLDVLALGDEAAASLGIDLDRLRAIVVLATALAVGAATSVTGGIAFVGLVVPHLVRRLVGPAPSRLVLASALAGGALVLVADAALRLLSPLGDLKLGVLTALVGAPFFLWLVITTRRELAP